MNRSLLGRERGREHKAEGLACGKAGGRNGHVGCPSAVAGARVCSDGRGVAKDESGELWVGVAAWKGPGCQARSLGSMQQAVGSHRRHRSLETVEETSANAGGWLGPQDTVSELGMALQRFCPGSSVLSLFNLGVNGRGMGGLRWIIECVKILKIFCGFRHASKNLPVR